MKSNVKKKYFRNYQKRYNKELGWLVSPKRNYGVVEKNYSIDRDIWGIPFDIRYRDRYFELFDAKMKKVYGRWWRVQALRRRNLPKVCWWNPNTTTWDPSWNVMDEY